MKEELEEGHFDTEGHFQWKKSTEVTDNWLDNLDWVAIKKRDEMHKAKEGGLADSSSDDDDDSLSKFDIIGAYRRILEVMKPTETIRKTLQRLGKSSVKLSSIERFRRKKAGIVDENAVIVTEITELCNNILTKMGNMDVYEETYEEIHEKFASKLKSDDKADDLDLFADDFDAKEKQKISGTDESGPSTSNQNQTATEAINNDIQWQFKWTMQDTELHGPYSTQQMQNWVDDGYFKDGVFVRKFGTDGQFNSSNRIDFDLYI